MNKYYEIKQELANELLNHALENDYLIYYMLMTGWYHIYSEKEIEEKGYPIQLVMEALYKKHRENPEINLDSKINDCMKKVFDGKSGKQILIVLKELEYQLMSEKKNTASFKINCVPLLQGLSQNIKNNKQYFEKRISELEDHNDYLDRHYGHRFL